MLNEIIMNPSVTMNITDAHAKIIIIINLLDEKKMILDEWREIC